MNGIVIVDKPRDWTSHDVVGKLRGIYHERRVGHSGTLDPMATGVLVVFIGRATRAVEFAESHEKEYLAEILFGRKTDTQDITGRTLEESDACPTREQLEEAASRFRGEIRKSCMNWPVRDSRWRESPERSQSPNLRSDRRTGIYIHWMSYVPRGPISEHCVRIWGMRCRHVPV